MNVHSMVPKEDKRAAILDAALELFADRGFDGAAVPAVAERAGVGAGTIYRYFASKEALVNAVFQEHKGRLVSTLVRDFPFDRPPREQFHVFWQRAAAFAQEHPRAFRFLELHHHAPYLDAQSRAIEGDVEGLAERFFEETARQKLTKPMPPAALVAIVWGALVYIVKAASTGYVTLTPDLLRDTEQAVWEAIRA